VDAAVLDGRDTACQSDDFARNGVNCFTAARLETLPSTLVEDYKDFQRPTTESSTAILPKPERPHRREAPGGLIVGLVT
jgi:hypothetical protein